MMDLRVATTESFCFGVHRSTLVTTMKVGSLRAMASAKCSRVMRWTPPTPDTIRMA
jgi:hypothetical protein